VCEDLIWQTDLGKPPNCGDASSRTFLPSEGIYRTTAAAGIGSACGLGANSTPDLRESARAVPQLIRLVTPLPGKAGGGAAGPLLLRLRCADVLC
jgi:hypothetical protein